MLKMRVGIEKHSFKSFEEFKALVDIALSKGFKTVKEFNKFLNLHFSK